LYGGAWNADFATWIIGWMHTVTGYRIGTYGPFRLRQTLVDGRLQPQHPVLTDTFAETHWSLSLDEVSGQI
jgi:hypothetical protein